MIDSVAGQSLFNVNRPVVENRNRLAQVRDVESAAIADRGNSSTTDTAARNSQRVEGVRSTELSQRTERDAPRVRRDDNSDLNFQARQALEQFNQVEAETIERNEPVFSGVDLFV